MYWREYVLFNPMHGYAYLAEYNGHWILLKTATEHPTFGKKMRHSFDLEGESYQLYHRYTAQVVFAQGEFYYDITDSGNYTEYVSPPWMMTRELRKKEVGWYKGEYVAPADLAKASQEAAKIPPRIGIGACQPNHVTQQYQETLRVSLVALLLLLLLQGWLVTSARKNEVLRESYDLQDSIVASSYPATSAKPLITPSFSLKEGTKNMEVELYSAVDNSWFEAEMTLVNEATGAERDLNMGVEYYHGYEDGEYWTEGEQRTEEVLSAVPEGSYHLVIVPSKPASFAHVEVRVRRDVPTWSNFCIAIVLLAILPAIQYYRKYRFEKQRWMNSDYSPYDE